MQAKILLLSMQFLKSSIHTEEAHVLAPWENKS